MLTCHECNGKIARFFVALTAVTLVFDSLQLIALTTEIKGCHGNVVTDLIIICEPVQLPFHGNQIA